MSFGNLINFYCEDIEEKHGIPYDVTYDFFKSRKVPYAFVKIYQEYFRTPWFSKLLDEFQLKSYHIGAEKSDNLQENEFIEMDDSFLDVGIESGDIFAVSPGEYTSYFQAIEFNGYVMPAYIISSDKKETVIEFDHEDFEPVVLPTNRIKFLGSIEKMKVNEGITEHLKADDQMEWVARINNIEARAREIVNYELIFTA